MFICKGDVCRKEDVERALRGADCVFHLAAFGMSGKEMLQFGRVDEVNINGTCHVLDACLDLGITRLVYCSTYNVVFGGQQIMNGNEALPYFPIDQHADPYGRSKSIAEQLVLKNNARPLKYVCNSFEFVPTRMLCLLTSNYFFLLQKPIRKSSLHLCCSSSCNLRTGRRQAPSKDRNHGKVGSPFVQNWRPNCKIRLAFCG